MPDAAPVTTAMWFWSRPGMTGFLRFSILRFSDKLIRSSWPGMTKETVASSTDRRVDRFAMPNQIWMRGHERFQRRCNREKVNVGDEAINAGIDAGWLHPMRIAIRWNEIGQHLQIRQSARIGLVGR